MTNPPPTIVLDLDDLLLQIVGRAQELIPFDSGGITVYDAETRMLAPRTYRGATRDAPMPRLVQLGEGVIGHVAQTRQPMRIDDVSADPNYVPYDMETRSELAVPLLLNDELLGIFNVESSRVAAYTDQHVKILQALAEEAALAIHMVRLYQVLSRRYERLNDYNDELFLRNEISRLTTSDLPIDVLLPQIAERLAKLISADACVMALWDAREQRSRRIAGYGITTNHNAERPSGVPSLTADIIRTGKTYIINDTKQSEVPPSSLVTDYGARAILGMPLIARGRPIGATYLLTLRGERSFSQADADKATAVLDQIALTIDNNVLLQNTQARLSETSALLEIAEIAASSLELDDMLRQVLKLSQQMLGVQCGTFLLYDRQTNMLAPRSGAWFGFTQHLSEMHFPVADPGSPIAIVFTSGSPQFINDLKRASLRSRTQYEMLSDNLRNVLVAPLRVQDEPIGVFLVGNKHDDFTRNDANLLMAMGSHVAAALRNVELLADTRVRLRETEALQKIAAITSSTLDLDEMLEAAVRETAVLMNVEGAVLMMPDLRAGTLVPHDRSRYGIARHLPYEPIPLDSQAGHIVNVYNTGEAYVSNDPPSDPIMERRNIITYPLRSRNRPLGTISLINRKSGEFEESHVELTRAIASQIATSMENAQLFAAERARADLMSLINRISQELTATLDQQGLMRKVVSAIHELLGYETVVIFLLDDSGMNVSVRASVSSMPAVTVPEGFTFPITQGVVGRAMRTGETQVVASIRDDKDFFTLNDALTIGSDLVVPLRAGTRVLGAVEAIATRPNAFQKTDHMAMETLAAQVSILIENARLWNQAQRRLLEQSIVHQIGQDLTSILDYNELVNAVVQHVTRALDTSLCLLTSYDPETGHIAVEAEYRTAEMQNHPLPPFMGQPLGADERGIITQAVQSRRQVIAYREGADTAAQRQYFLDSGIYAQLTLPMIAGDRVVGCIVWIETRAARDFTDGDVRLAQTLTTQAAIAIENARLFRQAQRQAREQTLLRRIAVGLSVMPDMESLLRQLAYETSQALEVDSVVLALRDDTGRFPVRAYYLLTRTANETALGRANERQGLAALFQTLEQGSTLQFSTATLAGDDPVKRDLQELAGERPVSLLLTPIMRRGDTIGLIEVADDAAARVFARQDIQLLEAIANQGAIAIDNVSLYEREQRRLRQLEKLQISSRTIAGELQTDLLLNRIVKEAAAIFEVDAVSLMTTDPGSDYYTNRASIGLSERYMRDRRVLVREQEDTWARTVFLSDGTMTGGLQDVLVREENLRSVLSVPIMKAGQRLGILNLYSKGMTRTFTDEERDLAQLFASQAATALENATLFKELQDRAVELAKANQLKSEFLARVSHELRTPMNSINGYSEMLLRLIYGDLTEKQADRIERILRNGRNLLAIIDDLLDISKIDAGKMELQIGAVNLRDEMSATIYNLESQAAARGLYLKLDAPENIPPVRADSMRLRQIITNLLGNAMKFTKQGGVTVRIQVVNDDGHATVWTSVADTGIGIRREDQQIIFDEFRQADGSTTREYGGTGLGLAITKKLVEMMQGRIWVESEVGKGSTFTFVLPVASGDKVKA
ncbi:MAG: GAF domain-containing protein [Anaerolineae bacterium]|nr:GAF domain-containing protein [Anaerolineae bacterium]